MECVEGFQQVLKYSTGKAIATGNAMHFEYSVPYKSFDRRIIRFQLDQMKRDNAFERQVDNILVRGQFDDLRVLWNPRTKGKTISFVEVKTTGKDRMWFVEEASAIFQLQLYIWVMKPYLEKLGYKLNSRHYLEIYSQKSNRLLKRVMVTDDLTIEDRIRYIVNSWRGLEKVTFPHQSTCKICPCKKECDWYANSRIL